MYDVTEQTEVEYTCVSVLGQQLQTHNVNNLNAQLGIIHGLVKYVNHNYYG